MGGMDHVREFQKLTADACDALRAAADILADPDLPIFHRIQAHDRCMDAFRKLAEKIPAAAELAIAQEMVRNSMI